MTGQALPPLSLDFLSEPALLLDAAGQVVGGNAAARGLFGPGLAARTMESLFADPPARLRAVLQSAISSTAPVMGALTPALADAPQVPRRLRMARLTAGPEAAPLVVLHFAAETEVRFRKLRETVRELEAVLRERMAEKAELHAALQHNRLLYRELQHRGKNNIHLIGALLRMSAREHDTPEVQAVIEAATSRIQAMGRTQEAIYEARGLGVVEAGALVERLLRGLSASLMAQGQIECDVQPLKLRAEAAHNLALIVNELATNALKYGRQDASARLAVRFAAVTGGELELAISDNGPGFDPVTVRRSSGLTLVEALVEQLNGSMRLDGAGGDGARWRITLPADLCGDEDDSAGFAA